MMWYRVLLLVASFLSHEACGQLTWATGCEAVSGGRCSTNGTSAKFDASGLTYSSTTGKFTGKLKGNRCPNHPYYSRSSGIQTSCREFTFPASGYTSAPKAAPIRGQVGYTMALTSIFGPFEAGFGGNRPELCSKSGVAACEGGMDIPSCDAKATKECVAAGGTILHNMLLDDCGGHAEDNYHYHLPMRCMYDKTGSTHSGLVGIALDGHGIYGVYEENGSLPSVDACNGHTGPVPGDADAKTTASSVYHYHVTPYAPFTLGCYGPVASVDECKQLYPTCGDGTISFTGTDTNGKEVNYTNFDLDCPCHQQNTKHTSANVASIAKSYQNLVTNDPFDDGSPIAYSASWTTRIMTEIVFAASVLVVGVAAQ